MKLKELKKSIDWCIIIIPFLGIVSLCTLFILKPEESGEILTKIRYFFSKRFLNMEKSSWGKTPNRNTLR